MNKLTCAMMVGAVLPMSAPAMAETRAVNVSIGVINIKQVGSV